VGARLLTLPLFARGGGRFDERSMSVLPENHRFFTNSGRPPHDLQLLVNLFGKWHREGFGRPFPPSSYFLSQRCHRILIVIVGYKGWIVQAIYDLLSFPLVNFDGDKSAFFDELSFGTLLFWLVLLSDLCRANLGG
jgi:hypothetical protein